MLMSHLRTGAMLAAFVLGAFSPWAGQFNWLIKWLLVIIMFPVLVQCRLSIKHIRRGHIKLFAANVLIGIGVWALLLPFGDSTLAQAAFFTAITPTATAAAVVIHLLGGRVQYAVTAFVLTNAGMALLLPFLVPLVIGNPAPAVFWGVVQSMLFVIGLPLAAAMLVRRFYRNYAAIPGKTRNLTFFLWTGNVFLIIANASAFLRSQSGASYLILLEIALISLGLCIFCFWFGQFLDTPRYRREAGQCLGQKNTSLTIYLALSCANPLVALGPTMYVLWHNSWNTVQLHMRGRRENRRRRRRMRNFDHASHPHPHPHPHRNPEEIEWNT